MSRHGRIGMDFHDTGKLVVKARDINTFWTIQIEAFDREGNVLSTDLYVQTFDEEVMEAYASALVAGAKSIRELARAKQRPCKDCEGTAICPACEGTGQGGL